MLVKILELLPLKVGMTNDITTLQNGWHILIKLDIHLLYKPTASP
jgi:hypothetical protein